MPQRDVARATSAATAPSALPGAPESRPDGARHDIGRPSGAGASEVPPGPAPATGTGAPPDSGPAQVPPPASPAPPPDARALARAGLAAGRSPSLWWACAGIGLALAVTFAFGAPAGAFVLAAVLAVSALARAVLRPAPVALAVRSRLLDSVVLAGLALALGLLAPLIPTR
jgi:Protein of unknown function (DUF3017)